MAGKVTKDLACTGHVSWTEVVYDTYGLKTISRKGDKHPTYTPLRDMTHYYHLLLMEK